MLRFTTMLLFAVALVSACTPDTTEPQSEPVDMALIERGIAVYRENYCGTCHTLEAAGTRGIFGPDHNQAAALAAERIASDNYSGAATTVEEYLRESLLEPQRYIVESYLASAHPMPAYTHLDPADIEAMVYLLLQQG